MPRNYTPPNRPHFSAVKPENRRDTDASMFYDDYKDDLPKPQVKNRGTSHGRPDVASPPPAPHYAAPRNLLAASRGSYTGDKKPSLVLTFVERKNGDWFCQAGMVQIRIRKMQSASVWFRAEVSYAGKRQLFSDDFVPVRALRALVKKPRWYFFSGEWHPLSFVYKSIIFKGLTSDQPPKEHVDAIGDPRWLKEGNWLWFSRHKRPPMERMEFSRTDPRDRTMPDKGQTPTQAMLRLNDTIEYASASRIVHPAPPNAPPTDYTAGVTTAGKFNTGSAPAKGERGKSVLGDSDHISPYGEWKVPAAVHDPNVDFIEKPEGQILFYRDTVTGITYYSGLDIPVSRCPHIEIVVQQGVTLVPTYKTPVTYQPLATPSAMFMPHKPDQPIQFHPQSIEGK